MGGQIGGPRGAREYTAEIFDPTSEKFQRAASMHDARFKITDAAVLLPNGEVLVAGGSDRAGAVRRADGPFLPCFRITGLGSALRYGDGTARRLRSCCRRLFVTKSADHEFSRRGRVLRGRSYADAGLAEWSRQYVSGRLSGGLAPADAMFSIERF